MKTYMTALLLVATAMAQPIVSARQLEGRAPDQLLNLQVGGTKKPFDKPALIDISALTRLLGGK